MGKFELDPIQFFVYFGILNTVILFPLLFFSKKQSKANRWLALLLLGLTFNLLNYTLFSRLFQSYTTFTLDAIPIIFAFGPILWMYVAHMTIPGFQAQKKHVWYFIPFFADLLYWLGKAVYVRLFDLENKSRYFSTDHPGVQLEFLLHDGLAILFTGYIFSRSFVLISKHRQGIKHIFSSTEDIALSWLHRLLFVLLLILVTWTGYHVVEISIFPDALSPQRYYPFWAALIAIVLIIGYRSLLQNQIPLYESSNSKQFKRQKYRSSNLDENELAVLAQNLKNLIEEQKLFLSPSLKLSDLSEAVGQPPHTVSQVISQGLDTTFYDLINSYRVEEVKRCLDSPEHRHKKLIALAFDAGFNSKTAFYSAFKKWTGLSPSEYRNRRS